MHKIVWAMKKINSTKSDLNINPLISENNEIEEKILSSIQKREEEIEALKKLLDNLLKTPVKNSNHKKSK